MKKIAFIINPNSGTHSKNNIVHLIDRRIDKTIYEPEVIYTEYAGHAVEIAQKLAAKNYDTVVAVGGDGTINEIGRSLAGTSTKMAIIPCGSGNGLARHLGIPLDVSRAIDIINESNSILIDYGKINDTLFFCTCGVGFDASISFKFAHAGKRGLITYLEKTLQEWLNYKPETYELETEDGTYNYKAFLIACGNASQYGNNAYITPQATLNDGLLDVTILQPFTVLDIPALSFQLFNKTINQNSKIKSFKCKKLIIKRKEEGMVHFDGDPMQTSSKITIEVVKDGLYVIAPKEKKGFNKIMMDKAEEYVNGIKTLNYSFFNNINKQNKKLLEHFKSKKEQE